MGMPPEISRKILQELLTIDANHKTEITPPITNHWKSGFRIDEYHKAAAREVHTCIIHSGVLSTSKRLYEEGRDIPLGENEFVAILGEQSLIINALKKWNVHSYWVPTQWAGKWSRESMSFELPHCHYSPNITIAYSRAIDSQFIGEPPVLIPVRHLSVAVLAAREVKNIMRWSSDLEIYLHSKNGKNWFGARQPVTVEELQKKIFIGLGKYVPDIGCRCRYSGDVLTSGRSSSRTEMLGAVSKAIQETKAYGFDQDAEESALYKHLRGFVVEMDEYLNEDKQVQAFSKFQEFARQMSMSSVTFWPHVSLGTRFHERFYDNKFARLYAHACYRIVALTNPELLGWEPYLFHLWCIDRAFVLRYYMPEWRCRSLIMYLKAALALEFDHDKPLQLPYRYGMVILLANLAEDCIPAEVVDEVERRNRAVAFLRQRLQHLTNWPQDLEIWPVPPKALRKPVWKASSADVKAALLEIVLDLEIDLDVKYGPIAGLR
jgi:hypothetical protein